MLKLIIRFESSWSNQLFEAGGNVPLFTSSSKVSESTKRLTAVDIPEDTPGLERSRIDYLRALQKQNPDMLYRVPASFDSTVQGVLARLMGEVRRMNDIRRAEPDHLAIRAFNAGEYRVVIEDEYSQTTSLASYEANDIQTGGAGLIQDSVLWGDTAEGRLLFGHLGMSLNAMEQACATGQPLANSWFATAPAHLLDRLAELKEEQDREFKAAQLEDRAPYPALTRELEKLLPADVESALEKQRTAAAQGKKAAVTLADGALSAWNLAAAFVVARIRALSEESKAELVRQGALTDRGNLAGMAMSGNIGSITPKDMYAAATGKKAQSYRMPYRTELPVQKGEKKVYIDSGVLKKNGTVEFVINDHAELEREVKAAIDAACVGPFHFGKKGVAYVETLRLI